MEWISAYMFAERKKVSNTIVYQRIKSGEIETVLIGKTKYIDWDKYKDIKFPKAKNSK